MKKIIAIFLILIIFCSNIVLVCYAEDISGWEYLLSYFTSFYYLNNIAPNPDKLIDYWDNKGDKFDQFCGLYWRTSLGDASVIPEYMAIHDLQEASDGRYMCAQLHKDQLDGIHDAFDDYWASDSAEIRSLSFSDLGITISPNANPISRFGSVAGSGPAARYNSADNYMRFCPNLPSNFNWNALYIFNGNIYYPPVLFSQYRTLIQGDTMLPAGYYYVLSLTELLYCGSKNPTDNQTIEYDDVDDLVGIDNFVCNRWGYITPVIYENGVAHNIGPDGDYSYDEVVQKFQMSIGLHLNVPEMVGADTYSIKEPPSNVPYDDDDNVVVMVPIDSIGEPIYMNPTTYNNYINNGNIYNTDDHSNNIVNNDSVENITNIYNNYVTNNNTTNNNTTNNYNFDDTNILNKLDIIIGKLNDILYTSPNYENFGDIIAQVPLIGEVRTMINDYKDALVNDDTVPEIEFTLFGVNDSITFDWYLDYQEQIKSILRVFAYICGVVSCWLNLKSAFDIHYGGGG